MKKSLVVTIDDYPGRGNDLESCRKDGDDFVSHLREHHNFTTIKRVNDSDATRRRVRDGLGWLFEDVSADDRLVFYFSGHGSQRSIDDTLEEFLELYDGSFKDDLLVNAASSIPKGVLTVVLDCCFSGGLGKDFIAPFQNIGGQPCRAKFFFDVENVSELGRSKSAGNIRSRKAFGFRPLSVEKPFEPLDKSARKNTDEQGQQLLNGLLVSASLENELAMSNTDDTEGRSAFTHCLLTAIDLTGLDATTEALISNATEILRQLDFSQTPVVVEPSEPGNLARLSFIGLDQVSRSGRGNGGRVATTTSHELIVIQPNVERLTIGTLRKVSHSVREILQEQFSQRLESELDEAGTIRFFLRE